MAPINEVWYGVVTDGTVPRSSRVRLSAHPFFQGMDPRFLETINEAAVEMSYRPGELLAEEGAVADRFILIYQGSVALELNGLHRAPCRIQVVGPGETLGWSWVRPPYRWPHSARAVKETVAASLDAAMLRATLQRRPSDGYDFLLRLLGVVGERLESTRGRVPRLPAP